MKETWKFDATTLLSNSWGAVFSTSLLGNVPSSKGQKCRWWAWNVSCCKCMIKDDERKDEWTNVIPWHYFNQTRWWCEDKEIIEVTKLTTQPCNWTLDFIHSYLGFYKILSFRNLRQPFIFQALFSVLLSATRLRHLGLLFVKTKLLEE